MPEDVVVAAAETPVVASEPQEVQTEPTEPQEPQQEPEKKKDGGFQRRIDKLVREKSEREREVEYWKQQALKTAETKPAATPVADAEPDPNKFDNQAEYIKALTKYNVNQAKREFEAEQREAQSKARQQEQQREFAERKAQFAADIPDFDEVVAGSDAPVSQALMEEMTSNENGPALMYYLAQNPDEAERLSQLSPVALARAVTRLESKFIPAAKQEVKQAVSKAPKPPTPVGGSGKTAEKDPSEMDPSEYRAWRAKTYPHLQ